MRIRIRRFKKGCSIRKTLVLFGIILLFYYICCREEMDYEILYTYNESLAIHPGENPTRYLNNLTDFFYLRNNPRICYENRLYNQLLIVLVHSARSNLVERSRIRQTLGSFKTIKGWDIRLAFILGKKPSKIFENFTLELADDLIVGNFEDTYQNLSYKHSMVYKWTVEFCPDARFLAKIDDDAYINFVDYLQEISYMQMTYQEIVFSCLVIWESWPMRENRYKNYVSVNDYSGEIYPAYCSGPGYLIDMVGVKLIYEGTLEMKFFLVDDVWITGLIRAEKQIGIRNFKGYFNLVKYGLHIKSYETYLRGNVTKGLLTNWREKFALYLNYDDIKAKILIN